MKLLVPFFVCMLLFTNCKSEQKVRITASEIISARGVDIPVYTFDNFKPLLEMNDGKIRVINFWATWCKPCVVELPFFELLNGKYKDRNVEVILVSLDVPQQITSKLIPFLKRQRIQSKVMLLDDPDANSWIPQVNKNWSGSIPATIIYKGNKVRFYEQSLTFNELEKELKYFL